MIDKRRFRRIDLLLNRRFCFRALTGVRSRRGGGKGFFDVERKGPIVCIGLP